MLICREHRGLLAKGKQFSLLFLLSYIWPEGCTNSIPGGERWNHWNWATVSAFILIPQPKQSWSSSHWLSHMWGSSGFPVFDTTQMFPGQERCAHLLRPPMSSIQPFLTEGCNYKLLLEGVVEWPTAVRKWRGVIQAGKMPGVPQHNSSKMPDVHRQTSTSQKDPSCSLTGLRMMSFSSASGSMSRDQCLFPHKTQILQDETYLHATSARRY